MPGPLEGKRVVVTRPAAQAGAFCDLLRGRGAAPVRFPVIRIEEAPDAAALDAVLGRLQTFDWVVFTSVNGVRRAHGRLAQPYPEDARTAAIGPATASALAACGVRCDFMPEEFVAEGIVEGLGNIRGARILLLRALGARKALGTLLAARGAHVEEIAAYQTTADTPPPEAFRALRAGVDAITLTSSSTARHFHELVGTDAAPVDTAVIACIGPITAASARRHGYTVDIVAREYTTGGLLRALEDHFASR